MMKYSNREWNYNMKLRRELHAYKDSPIKTTILVLEYIRIVSNLFLFCSINNKLLNTVISSSFYKKIIAINLPYL